MRSRLLLAVMLPLAACRPAPAAPHGSPPVPPALGREAAIAALRAGVDTAGVCSFTVPVGLLAGSPDCDGARRRRPEIEMARKAGLVTVACEGKALRVEPAGAAKEAPVAPASRGRDAMLAVPAAVWETDLLGPMTLDSARGAWRSTASERCRPTKAGEALIREGWKPPEDSASDVDFFFAGGRWSAGPAKPAEMPGHPKSAIPF